MKTEQPFQRLWGHEGGFEAAIYKAVISGLYSKMCKNLPVGVRDATNSERHPPALSVPGSRIETRVARNTYRMAEM